MSTPYSLPQVSQKFSSSTGARSETRLGNHFPVGTVSTKLCERHDAISSNLPIVKPAKTAGTRGKTACAAHAWHVLPGMGDTSTKAPSQKPDKPSAGHKNRRIQRVAHRHIRCGQDSPLNHGHSTTLKCLVNLTSKLTEQSDSRTKLNSSQVRHNNREHSSGSDRWPVKTHTASLLSELRRAPANHITKDFSPQ